MTTMGFRVVALKHKFYSIKVYDVGGAPQIRSIWKKYYTDVGYENNFLILITV